MFRISISKLENRCMAYVYIPKSSLIDYSEIKNDIILGFIAKNRINAIYRNTFNMDIKQTHDKIKILKSNGWKMLLQTKDTQHSFINLNCKHEI